MAIRLSPNNPNCWHSNELKADATDSLTVVLSKISDSLEIRHQTSGQPHQLHVALCFPLKTPAGLNPVEVTVDVDLQQDRGMISRPTSIRWNGTFKAQLDQIELIDENVDYTHELVSLT